jgi:hypothetical protein
MGLGDNVVQFKDQGAASDTLYCIVLQYCLCLPVTLPAPWDPGCLGGCWPNPVRNHQPAGPGSVGDMHYVHVHRVVVRNRMDSLVACLHVCMFACIIRPVNPVCKEGMYATVSNNRRRPVDLAHC